MKLVQRAVNFDYTLYAAQKSYKQKMHSQVLICPQWMGHTNCSVAWKPNRVGSRVISIWTRILWFCEVMLCVKLGETQPGRTLWGLKSWAEVACSSRWKVPRFQMSKAECSDCTCAWLMLCSVNRIRQRSPCAKDQPKQSEHHDTLRGGKVQRSF